MSYKITPLLSPVSVSKIQSFSIEFDEELVGLVKSDLVVSGGTIREIEGSGKSSRVEIEAWDYSALEISVSDKISFVNSSKKITESGAKFSAEANCRKSHCLFRVGMCLLFLVPQWGQMGTFFSGVP